MRSSNKILTAVTLIFIFIILCLISFSTKEKIESKSIASNFPSSPTMNLVNLEDFIAFTVPPGWTKEIKPGSGSQLNEMKFDSNTIELTSSDYRYNTEESKIKGDDGIKITILRFKINDSNKWRNNLLTKNGRKAEIGDGIIEVKKTEIDGKEAYLFSPNNDLTYDFKNPMNFPFIEILNENYVYRILTAPFDGSEHKKEFDSFVSSILFK